MPVVAGHNSTYWCLHRSFIDCDEQFSKNSFIRQKQFTYSFVIIIRFVLPRCRCRECFKLKKCALQARQATSSTNASTWATFAQFLCIYCVTDGQFSCLTALRALTIVIYTNETFDSNMVTHHALLHALAHT